MFYFYRFQNNAVFVLNKIKQKWLTQSILEKRVQDGEKLQNHSETLEVLCSDSELSDSGGSEQAYIIRSGDEESDGGHVWLVEETQRLTQAVHGAARTDTELNFLYLSQGGDASIQNHTQHSGTETLLPDEDESEARNNHSMTHTTAEADLEETVLFMQNGDQDSDVTQIDGDTGEFVSKSLPGTPKGKSRALSEVADQTAQRSSQTISTCFKAPTSLVKGEQGENADNNQCFDSQDASQSLLDSHAEPLPEIKKIKSPKKRRKISGEDVEVADTVMDSASGPLEVGRNAFPAVETGDSPLFKPVELGFLRRKKKQKKNDAIQCETNADASGDDITGPKNKHKDDKKQSREDNRTNEEQSCDTSRLSVGSDGTDVSSVKKKKKKKQKLEEQEDAEPTVDTQNDQESDSVSKKVKKKRKHQDTDDQDDNTTFNLSTETQGEKTIEPLEATCNVLASDSTRVKKKKKPKMKSQGEESNEETAQHIEAQTAVLSSKKAKKNKKTERTTCDEETTNVVENLEMRLNESIRPREAPEDTQTTEETERCSSPAVTLLKSVKKKKKRNASERPDACSVSQEENISSAQEFEERAGDVHQRIGDALNDAKRKKKRTVSQSEETPERRKKKIKGHSNGLIEESSELHTDHEVSGNSQSLMSTPSEIRPKKTKKKNEKLKEADKSTRPVSLEKGQTKETVHENNAEKQVTGNSGVKIKKRKKDIEFTDNDLEMISSSQVSQSDTPKRPKKPRTKNKRDDEETETVVQAHKIKNRKKECKRTDDAETGSVMEDHSGSQTDEVSMSKKKKRKRKVESIQDTQNSSIYSEAEGIETSVQNGDEEIPKIKKKKRKVIMND